MDALPFEYCGWKADGVAVWSRHFPKLFNLTSIQNIRDVQTALLPSDAAALEGMIWRLQQDNEPFVLEVRTTENNTALRLHGVKGNDLDGIDNYDVLWVEDITEIQNNRDDIGDRLRKLELDIRQYRAVLDLIPQSIWVTGSANNIQWCNKQYTNITKEERASAIGNPSTLKALPIDKNEPPYEQLSTSALATNDKSTVKARIIIDGKRELNEISVLPDQREKLVVHVSENITEQETLRKELTRYVSANTELMEQLSTAICIFGADQKLEFHNPSFTSLWGLEDQWLNNHPSLGDILEKLRDNRRLPEQADFRTYKKSWLDLFTTLLEPDHYMMYLPDGLAIKCMCAPHPMGGLMMTFEDVTSRLELESSYNTLIAVQKETLDNLAEGVAVYGSDARLKLCNPSYLKLWKINPEDTEGDPHISSIVDKKKQFFKGVGFKWDTIKSRFTAHAIDRTDIRETIKRSDNTTIECVSVPLPDGGVMITYRDISDSMRIQEVLEEKNQALQEAENLKTDFLAKVSYQLRTPLNAISGFSEILDNEYFGEINEKQREYTTGIIDATNRLSSLINDILDLSSIEAGYLRLDKNPVDILDLMDTIYELSRDWAGMENVKIKYEKPKASPGTFILDENRIKQALLNIVRNAINFTPEGKNIYIAIKDNTDSVQMTVLDSGIGISDTDKDNIFRPFNGDDDSAAVGTGTGLGLTLAHDIISMHNGTIDVENMNGTGTLVTIQLPKAV